MFPLLALSRKVEFFADFLWGWRKNFVTVDITEEKIRWKFFKSKYCSWSWIDFKLVFIVSNLIKVFFAVLIGLNALWLCGKLIFHGVFKYFRLKVTLEGYLIAVMIYNDRYFILAVVRRSHLELFNDAHINDGSVSLMNKLRHWFEKQFHLTLSYKWYLNWLPRDKTRIKTWINFAMPRSSYSSSPPRVTTHNTVTVLWIIK